MHNRHCSTYKKIITQTHNVFGHIDIPTLFFCGPTPCPVQYLESSPARYTLPLARTSLYEDTPTLTTLR
jgi:hypothetical protein